MLQNESSVCENSYTYFLKEYLSKKIREPCTKMFTIVTKEMMSETMYLLEQCSLIQI